MANSSKKITIAVLNYNGLNYLRRTMPNILQMCNKDTELLVVDNGSKDGSVEYLNTIPEIKVIQNSLNVGYSKGKNIAVQHATGEFVYLIDNDILFEDKSTIDFLHKEYVNLSIIGFLSLVMVNDGQEDTKYYSYCYGFFGPIYNTSIKLTDIKKDTYVSGAPLGGNIFFRKEIWKDIGGYDELQPYYLDDFDVGARSNILGYKSYVSSKYVLKHLGVDQINQFDRWLWKFRYFFSGYSIVMFKNYKISNLVFRYPLFILFSITKAFKYAIIYRSIRPLTVYFDSVYFFLSNIKYILSERNKIQNGRSTNKDLFLSIKPPIFK